MTSCTIPSAVPSDASVQSLLVSVHDRWLEQVRTFMAPATVATAGFWDRWSATRFLNDQFLDHFNLERTFLTAIVHLLDQKDQARLTEQAIHIENLRVMIDRVGRQRGTGSIVADEAAELVRDLSIWCAEMELAVAELRRDMLPPRVAVLLDHLIASASLTAK